MEFINKNIAFLAKLNESGELSGLTCVPGYSPNHHDLVKKLHAFTINDAFNCYSGSFHIDFTKFCNGSCGKVPNNIENPEVDCHMAHAGQIAKLNRIMAGNVSEKGHIVQLHLNRGEIECNIMKHDENPKHVIGAHSGIGKDLFYAHTADTIGIIVAPSNIPHIIPDVYIAYGVETAPITESAAMDSPGETTEFPPLAAQSTGKVRDIPMENVTHTAANEEVTNIITKSTSDKWSIIQTRQRNDKLKSAHEPSREIIESIMSILNDVYVNGKTQDTIENLFRLRNSGDSRGQLINTIITALKLYIFHVEGYDVRSIPKLNIRIELVPRIMITYHRIFNEDGSLDLDFVRGNPVQVTKRLISKVKIY